MRTPEHYLKELDWNKAALKAVILDLPRMTMSDAASNREISKSTVQRYKRHIDRTTNNKEYAALAMRLAQEELTAESAE